jgi:hypothetical protein
MCPYCKIRLGVDLACRQCGAVFMIMFTRKNKFGYFKEMTGNTIIMLPRTAQ